MSQRSEHKAVWHGVTLNRHKMVHHKPNITQQLTAIAGYGKLDLLWEWHAGFHWKRTAADRQS